MADERKGVDRRHASSESSAQPILRNLSVNEAVTYALENAVDPRGERIPIKHVADLMGVRRSRIYEITSEERPAKASELSLIVRATNIYLPADAVEYQIGRAAFVLPTPGSTGDAPSVKLARLCTEVGDVMRVHGESAADGKYSRDEVDQQRAQIRELIAAAAAYQRELEEVQTAPSLSVVKGAVSR